jgi:hypothetical protein
LSALLFWKKISLIIVTLKSAMQFPERFGLLRVSLHSVVHVFLFKSGIKRNRLWVMAKEGFA